MAYVRQRIPPRYGELSNALETNVRGVLYGAIYSTFLTQTIKSLIILAMNLVFHVPLAGVLAILSFIIGFFPIVGSWSVYLPVAGVARHLPRRARASAGDGPHRLLREHASTSRPSSAPRSRRSGRKVLNFYWMLVALITGVYTFGLVGILLGPMLIGLLKAILDTITSQPAWDWTDHRR